VRDDTTATALEYQKDYTTLRRFKNDIFSV